VKPDLPHEGFEPSASAWILTVSAELKVPAPAWREGAGSAPTYAADGTLEVPASGRRHFEIFGVLPTSWAEAVAAAIHERVRGLGRDEVRTRVFVESMLRRHLIG
jgi:hypothetical protein